MFETSRTTFETFFLRSYVVFGVCGRFFEEWGMAISKSGKSATVSDCKVISAEWVIVDFDK